MDMLSALREAARQGVLARPLAWRGNGKGCYVNFRSIYVWDRAHIGAPRLVALSNLDIIEGEWEPVSQSQIIDEVVDGR